MDNEGNLENNRYHPQHPLPEEIQEMARDDTVCQFCGVSYLIHNEIKNLQKELDMYKNEVERLKGFDEREKVLSDQVAMLTVKSNDLLEKWQVEVKRSNEHEELILQKNVHISQLKGSIEKYKDAFSSEKNKTDNLIQRLKEVAGIAVKIGANSKELHEKLSNSRTSYQVEFNKFTSSWNEQKSSIIKKVWHFVKLYNTCEKSNKQMQLDMEHRSITYKTKMQDDEIKYEKLQQCWRSLLESRSRIELFDNQIGKFDEKYSALVRNYSKNIVGLNKKVYILQTHVKSCQNRNYDEKSLMSSLEKYKHDNIQLKDERSRMVNAHQHQIKQLHDSFMEKLSEAEKWPAKFDQKVKELEERFNVEKSELLSCHGESLKKADEEHTEEYKQINKSKEKCKQDVRRLEEKLKEQQRKFNDEKSQLLKQVTESYEKAATETEARYAEMNEEKDNHLKLIRKLEQQLETMQIKFHGGMLKQVEQHEKEKKNMITIFDNKLSQLCKELDEEKTSNANFSNKEIENLLRRMEELQRALSSAKEIINEKTACIEENKNEITSLRDCVRRECEERFELTESLAEARTELLSLQRFGNNYNTPKKLASHPLIYSKQTNANKLKETRSHGRPDIKFEELSKPCSGGDLDGMKASLDTLRTSPVSVRSQNSSGGRTSSGPRYSKNKLRISLKNN